MHAHMLTWTCMHTAFVKQSVVKVLYESPKKQGIAAKHFVMKVSITGVI